MITNIAAEGFLFLAHKSAYVGTGCSPIRYNPKGLVNGARNVTN